MPNIVSNVYCRGHGYLNVIILFKTLNRLVKKLQFIRKGLSTALEKLRDMEYSSSTITEEDFDHCLEQFRMIGKEMIGWSIDPEETSMSNPPNDLGMIQGNVTIQGESPSDFDMIQGDVTIQGESLSDFDIILGDVNIQKNNHSKSGWRKMWKGLFH